MHLCEEDHHEDLFRSFQPQFQQSRFSILLLAPIEPNLDRGKPPHRYLLSGAVDLK